MKYQLLSNTLLIAILTLTACSEEKKLSATNEKNVEKVIISEDKTTLDIYCPTGICRFNLSSNVETTLTINMHYNDNKRFTKIEGVSINGNINSNSKIMNESSFTMHLEANSHLSNILVIDYYR